MRAALLCLAALLPLRLAVAAPADAPQSLTGVPLVTAEQTAVETPVAKPDVIGHSGVAYQFSLSNWTVFNGSPLAYTPVEIGYDFGNGMRLMTGIDLFFYDGQQDDAKVAPGVLHRYSYEMQDWKTTFIYRVPLQIRLRPIVGLSVEAVGGQRKLAPDFSGPGGADINAGAGKFAAWGFLGASPLLGLEYMINPSWALNLSGRYAVTFSTVDSPIITELGLLLTF